MHIALDARLWLQFEHDTGIDRTVHRIIDDAIWKNITYHTGCFEDLQHAGQVRNRLSFVENPAPAYGAR
jgi:hypothetical protein